MLPEKDRIRLRHMQDAIREAPGYVQNRSCADLDRETMLLRALVNCIGIVGEAAAHVSEKSRGQMVEIPWQAIVGMRNRLIHGYFDINKDVVWTTVTHDFANLERQISTVLDNDSEYS
ncbi:MAG: DUF86 domain-containing protein [Candidatus Sumerlaeia bacterium]